MRHSRARQLQRENPFPPPRKKTHQKLKLKSLKHAFEFEVLAIEGRDLPQQFELELMDL